MANRIVTATVTGESIKLSEKSAGAAGSFNAVSLAFTFDGAWDGTTKIVQFLDTYGENPVNVTLTTNLLVDGAYIVPIPAEPLVYAGEMTVTVRGIDFEADGTTAERIIVSASTTMKVLNSLYEVGGATPVEPTPTQTEQLQTQIDGILADIALAAQAAGSATAAAASALAAQTAETNAELAESNAETAETNAKTSETNAGTYATNASNSALAASGSATTAVNAKTSAETAQGLAETAQAAAQSAQTGAISAKDAAVIAKTASETAQGLAETANTSAQGAKTASQTAQGLAEAAQTAAQGYASTAHTDSLTATTAKNDAVAAKTAAELAETNAETAQAAAELAETHAETAESNASTHAINAGLSATAAAGSATDANNAKVAAQTAQTNAELAETHAETAEVNAEAAETNATAKATLSESYAKGGTGTRAGEDTDNAKYYKEQAAAIVGGDYPTKTEAQGYVSAHDSSGTAHSTLFGNKVDKVAGKGLSTEDYTTTEKNKLSGIEASANNYVHPTTAGNKHIPAGGASGQFLKYFASGTAVWSADNNTITTVNGKTGVIAKADVVALGIPAQDTVYTHPANHAPSIITQDASNRFVTDAEKAEWNGKANPPTAVTATLSTTWEGSGPFAQSVTVSGVTSTNNITVSLASTADEAQRNAARDALLSATAQATNSITVTADGDKPAVALPIQVLILGG